MKIAVECDCLLLDASVRLFLGSRISPKSDCDFIVCDRVIASQKPIFVLGSDVAVPFTSEGLDAALNSFERNLRLVKNRGELESKIDKLVEKFKFDLINLIRNER